MAIYVDDKELVAAHKAGDQEAFEELVREYRSALFAHGRRKLSCDAAAEDAVQETLVRAYRALPRFNGEYRLGPWLHRILANVCIDEVHRRTRDGDKVERLSTEPVIRESAPSAEEELGLHIEDLQVTQAYGALPDSYQEALKLRFVDELDYSEVARASGVSEQNARARVSRARSAMKIALRGVAALPALLAIGMKRGEKAAAAATSASAATTSASVASNASISATQTASNLVAGMPTIAEAAVSASQAAPVVVPTIAKAAVGLGLAAAVFTPSNDSALHDAVDSVMAPPVVETVVDDSPNALTEAAFESQQKIEASDELLIVRTPSAFESETSNSEVVATQHTGTAQIDSHSPSPATAGQGSISMTQMELLFDGADRYLAKGQMQLRLDEYQVEGSVVPEASWMRIIASSDSDQGHRLDGDFVLLPQGELGRVQVRLSGFAEATSQGYVLSGLYRIDGEILDGRYGGFFSGSLSHRTLAEASHMELRLTP